MKRYFDNLTTVEKNIFDLGECRGIQIPNEMVNKDSWKYTLSSVTEEDLECLQQKYNVHFPEIYKQFISTYAHLVKTLQGNLDDFLFEDDVDVVLEIPRQPYGKELEEIELLFESNKTLLDLGFIPIGEFDNAGIISIDLLGDNRIFWIDYEEYYECDTREEIEDKGHTIFDEFEQLLDCFFLKKTHDCGMNEK